MPEMTQAEWEEECEVQRKANQMPLLSDCYPTQPEVESKVTCIHCDAVVSWQDHLLPNSHLLFTCPVCGGIGDPL